MKIARNKTTATAIALFLMLTIAGTLIAVLPTANAAVTNYNTYVYVGASPNPVGVNQQVLLVMWTAQIPPDIGEQTGLIPGGRAAWYNVAINVTKPDGTTETLVIAKTDPVGGSYVAYVPTTVGTYYAQAIFPETWKNTTTNQAHYSAAISGKVPFTVQQEPIQPWPETPLPAGYWTRPINTANRFWYALEGNWLGGAYQQPLGAAGGTTATLVTGKGPESAHILWTKPYYAGGLMDESFGNIGYETAHYEGINLGNPIILQGKLFYVDRRTAHTTGGWWVVDLYTGETLYFDNNTLGITAIPSFGQIYNYESGNQHGGFPYLWRTTGVTINNPGGVNGTVWEMLDGYTMNSVTKIANVTSGGTAVYGKDGSLLRYNLVNYGTTAAPNYYLQVWNSSAIPSELSGTTGTSSWMWRPAGRTMHDGSKGFSLNASLGNIYGPRNALLNETGSIRAVREDEYVIIGTGGRNDERGAVPGVMMAFNLKPDNNGGITPTKLWDMTFTPPAGSQAANVTISFGGVYPEDNVILFENTNLLKRWGYSLKTGEKLWEWQSPNEFAYYGLSDNYYKGIFYSYGYYGQINAFNITTGEVLWTYNATSVGLESSYGGNYPIGIDIIADGKLYTASSEHSPTQPLYRGPNLRCINATTGADIWNILFWGARMSPTESNIYMADGILVGLNYYDMQLYAFGKGPSATTVSAPQTVPSLGSSVTITGTVTDQSTSGRRNTNGILDFVLKGTPAISDEDQSAWMEYMFMQQPIPANAKGVEVTLDAIDPNNNYIHIGTVTSDMNGNYGYAFTPEVPGAYQIFATFAGSAAYGPSYSTAYMTVGEAPPVVAEPQPEPAQPPLDMYLLYATIAIIIAIAIVGLLLLRKK
jgi:hypothetical protein